MWIGHRQLIDSLYIVLCNLCNDLTRSFGLNESSSGVAASCQNPERRQRHDRPRGRGRRRCCLKTWSWNRSCHASRPPPSSASAWSAGRGAPRSPPTTSPTRTAPSEPPAAGSRPPEIVFFAPSASGSSTTTAFYSSRLKLLTAQHQNPPGEAAARELLTVGNLRATDVVLSGSKPCRELTLLFQPSASAYHVCNLSTGELVSLPPCVGPWCPRAPGWGSTRRPPSTGW